MTVNNLVDPTDQLLDRASTKYPLLDAESERSLIARAKAGDEQAKKTLVSSNLLLVASIAPRYLYSGISIHDLIVIGTTGLIRAIDKFDVSRGCRFSTYAVNWIRQTMSRAVGREGRSIRVPAYVVARIMKIARTRNRLEIELGREASIEEIAAVVELTPTQVEWYEGLEEPLSLEGLSDNNGGISFEDLIPEHSIDPAEEIENKITRESIRRYLPKLTPIERLVVEKRFGIDCEEETLEEIGHKLKVTRERIRQIEAKALKKLGMFTLNDLMFV